jgi:hypothetical protein
MGVSAGHIVTFVRGPRARAVWFPFGFSLAGSTGLSASPGPLGSLVLLISMLVILGGLIAALFRIGVAIFHRQWRLSGERLILLIIAFPLIFLGLRSGDYVHLAVLYPYYREKIAQTSERPVRFPWGDAAVTVLDGIQYRTMLYDDTGKTGEMNDVEQHRAEGLVVIDHRLTGSFFIELTISCQLLVAGCAIPGSGH